MDLSNDLLSKIIGGDSWSKVAILNWNVDENIIKSGNNHTSKLSRLTVEYQRKGKIFKKYFILKVPSAHVLYEIGLRYKLYDKELPVYAHILEEMYKIDGEHIGPRLYHVDNKHSLILKDLSQSGYKMVDRVKQLDYEQCCLVFKSLAKFHALSVKLDQMGKVTPIMKDLLRSFQDSQNVLEMELFMKMIREYIQKISLKHEIVKKLVPCLKDSYFKSFLNEFHAKRSYCTLNHGDCWTGNTLFKFDKYGVAKKVKLIDFQRCGWMSPAYDIMYFTITSMKFEVFHEYFEILSKIYIESLNKMLHYLQCKPYTMEDLKADIDSIPYYILYVLIVCLPQFISSHEDPFDYTRCIKNENHFDLDIYNGIYQNEHYLELLEHWILYFEKKGKVLIDIESEKIPDITSNVSVE